MFLHPSHVAFKRFRRGYVELIAANQSKLIVSVYAYVPTTMSGFCSESQITCNSDYGTSLARGSFSFATGQWQTIWLLVILNQVGTANGVVQ
jgi:hypothetical protein